MDFRKLDSGFQKDSSARIYIARFGEYPEITGEDEDESTMVLETLTQIGQSFKETR